MKHLQRCPWVRGQKVTAANAVTCRARCISAGLDKFITFRMKINKEFAYLCSDLNPIQVECIPRAKKPTPLPDNEYKLCVLLKLDMIAVSWESHLDSHTMTMRGMYDEYILRLICRGSWPAVPEFTLSTSCSHRPVSCCWCGAQQTPVQFKFSSADAPEESTSSVHSALLCERLGLMWPLYRKSWLHWFH